MVSRRYELTDEQWDRIKQYFEVAKKNGRPYKNVRNTVNGIVWILRSGAAWRDLPARYGEWNTVYKCFSKWQAQGLFDLQDLSIDSTSVKVHKDAGSKKKS